MWATRSLGNCKMRHTCGLRMGGREQTRGASERVRNARGAGISFVPSRVQYCTHGGPLCLLSVMGSAARTPISRFAYKQAVNVAETMRAKLFAINYGNYDTTLCAKKRVGRKPAGCPELCLAPARVNNHAARAFEQPRVLGLSIHRRHFCNLCVRTAAFSWRKQQPQQSEQGTKSTTSRKHVASLKP